MRRHMCNHPPLPSPNQLRTCQLATNPHPPVQVHAHLCTHPPTYPPVQLLTWTLYLIVKIATWFHSFARSTITLTVSKLSLFTIQDSASIDYFRSSQYTLFAHQFLHTLLFLNALGNMPFTLGHF